MDIYLESLGCRLNQSEIETMARQLAAVGHRIVATPAEAEVLVLNTCAVTAQAERKTRHRISQLGRANPEARIALIGCYPTFTREACEAIPGVTWVLNNEEKERLVELLGRGSAPADLSLPMRTRATIKAQDGCDNACTFCVIRLLRGPGRSRKLADILAEVQARAAEGCQEAVLAGVNLGSYGSDQGVEGGLPTLIREILDWTDLPRLRVSAVEPWDVDEPLLELLTDPRVCRHLHMPLQAGHDETLRRMARPITTREYAMLVKQARDLVPDLALTTDLMVGFPGEDEAAFCASYDFVAQMAFARLHVFPYSPRPGTVAAGLPGHLPRRVRTERARAIRALGREMAQRFAQRFVGTEMLVLWEHERDEQWSGVTDNYLRVLTQASEDLHNQLRLTRLVAVEGEHLLGEVLEPSVPED